VFLFNRPTTTEIYTLSLHDALPISAPIARDVTLQALYEGDPPLEAYPSADRSRIKAQQERLRRERREVLSTDRERARAILKIPSKP